MTKKKKMSQETGGAENIKNTDLTSASSLGELYDRIMEEEKAIEAEKGELEAHGETFDEPWMQYEEDDRDDPIPDLLATIPDILSHLNGLDVIEHTNAEEEYKDLEDDEHLLEVRNPDGSTPLQIDVGEDGRFTLFYAGWHEHFEPCKGDYIVMLDFIRKIFVGDVCAVHVSSGKSRWLGGSLTHRRYVSTDDPDIVLKRALLPKEFQNEIHSTGGEIKVTYWDSRRNCAFVFPRKPEV